MAELSELNEIDQPREIGSLVGTSQGISPLEPGINDGMPETIGEIAGTSQGIARFETHLGEGAFIGQSPFMSSLTNLLEGKTPGELCKMAFGAAVIEDPTKLFQEPAAVAKQMANCEVNLKAMGIPESGIVLPSQSEPSIAPTPFK